MGATKAVTDATFVSDVLQSDKPVLVDFWAEWCAPCRKVEPLLDEIANEMGDKVDDRQAQHRREPGDRPRLPGDVGADADHLQGRRAGAVGRRRQAQGRPGQLHRVGALIALHDAPRARRDASRRPSWSRPACASTDRARRVHRSSAGRCGGTLRRRLVRLRSARESRVRSIRRGSADRPWSRSGRSWSALDLLRRPIGRRRRVRRRHRARRARLPAEPRARPSTARSATRPGGRWTRPAGRLGARTLYHSRARRR